MSVSGYLLDPFVTLGRLDREFDEIVRRAWGGRDRGVRADRVGFAPAADVSRDGDDVVVSLDLPGVDLDDVVVEVDRGRLVVRGERADEPAPDDGGVVLRERRRGAFRREFALPDGVAAESVTAGYDRGVLTVRLSGVAAKRRTRIPVAAGGTRATAPEAEAESGRPESAPAEPVPAEGEE
jgi:HSP20 family protein